MIQFSNEMKIDNDKLTSAALDHIPKQLETFFISKGIYPQIPLSSLNDDDTDDDQDDIIVEPYNPDADIIVPMHINDDTGEVTITQYVKPPPPTVTSKSNNSNTENKDILEQMKKLGKNLGKELRKNKQVRMIRRNFNSKKACNEAKQKLNQITGTNIF